MAQAWLWQSAGDPVYAFAMDRIDAAIIGAGVIGLAIARSLALAGRSVVILEREAHIGMGLSSRNSEVIHAGLYYPEGSLKERLCIAGRELLYDYCASRHVPHRRCGKVIFAADDSEISRLEEIASRGAAAGVSDLEWREQSAITALEPDLAARAALYSPSTGIVDSHALMFSLLGEAEDHGAVLARGTAVERVERLADGWRIHTGDAALDCAFLVNAAGIDAHGMARRMDALPPNAIPPLHFAKGSYFSYSGIVPFTHLIYPVPVPGGLGTHLTLDMAGQARFGPDVEWTDSLDYRVDPARKDRFIRAAQRIWPKLDPDRMAPAYAGIRPKLSGPGEPSADFCIQDESEHGLPGLINLFGIESPGLTAAIAIGARVAEMARQGG